MVDCRTVLGRVGVGDAWRSLRPHPEVRLPQWLEQTKGRFPGSGFSYPGSVMAAATELQGKYQKLAQEYSKVLARANRDSEYETWKMPARRQWFQPPLCPLLSFLGIRKDLMPFSSVWNYELAYLCLLCLLFKWRKETQFFTEFVCMHSLPDV